MMLYGRARASTQPKSATQVTANGSGTANARGWEIDSPSYRSGAAKGMERAPRGP